MPTNIKFKNGGRFRIIRCRSGGVVPIKKSRSLWRWWTKATLSELSQEGPVNISENKYGCVLPELMLTESDVCEVIPCTTKAKSAIMAVPVWVAAS